MQKIHRRRTIQADCKNFYTMSKKHLGLSIDPYTVEDIQKENRQRAKSLMKTTGGFTLGKRDKLKTFIAPKHLHPTTIDSLKNHPYFKQKLRERKMHKPTRGLPLSIKGKKEF